MQQSEWPLYYSGVALEPLYSVNINNKPGLKVFNIRDKSTCTVILFKLQMIHPEVNKKGGAALSPWQCQSASGMLFSPWDLFIHCLKLKTISQSQTSYPLNSSFNTLTKPQLFHYCPSIVFIFRQWGALTRALGLRNNFLTRERQSRQPITEKKFEITDSGVLRWAQTTMSFGISLLRQNPPVRKHTNKSQNYDCGTHSDRSR